MILTGSAPPQASAQGAVRTADTVAIRRELRQAASSYEHALRRSAPFRLGSSSSVCDERVGRFCLTYDTGDPPALPPEPATIKLARGRAISAHRNGLNAFGADSSVVAPLVRFLIEADSADAALTVARTGPPEWSDLLLGFAQFQRGQMDSANHYFERALSRLDSREKERALDPVKLLDPGERRRFERLAPAARTLYEDRLWRLADPLFLTAGNDARAEHFARYAWSRILSRAPVVTGATSWGWDIEELTRRFGPAFARTQDYGRGAMGETTVTEHFHPEQRTYVPPELTRTTLPLHLPGSSWPYDTIRSRNGLAPPGIRAMRTLEHAPSQFPASDSTILRVDGAFTLDSLVQLPTRIELGLFILDSTFRVVAERRATLVAAQPLVRASLELGLPKGAYAYSFEALESTSRQAVRARYLFGPGSVLISDPVLLEADAALPADRKEPGFRPLPSLVLAPNTAFAVYLDVSGLTPTGDNRVRYQVTLLVEETTRAGALTRAIRRVGRAVGLAGAGSPRVTWSGEAVAAASIPIAFRIGDLRPKRGYHRLRFTVTDLVSGGVRQSERIVLIR